MDIFQLIKKDHALVRKILEDMTSGKANQQEQNDLFEELKSELLLHNSVEEEVFYNTLKKDNALRSLIDHSYQEHEQVENLLKEMNAMASSDQEWANKIGQVKKLILQHVEKEENDIFQKAREILQEEHQQNLGKSFQELKEQKLREDDKDF